MFDFIVNIRQKRIIGQLLSLQRRKRICNIDEVQHMGLIFTVGSKEDWDTIYHFAKDMETGKRKVYIVGYQSSNTVINYIFTHSRMVICHEKDDFLFARVPKANITEPFLSQHFDVLINAAKEPTFFSKYMSAKSQADLKVTYVNDNNTTADNDSERIFDLIIHGNKPLVLQNYLTDVVKYLSMIKK